MLFGYLAACTRLELVTGVIILPQRQTALVAKQAAEVDLLTRRAVPAGRRARAGTLSSTRRSVRRSATRPADVGADPAAAPAPDRTGRRPTSASSIASPAPASRRCRCSVRSRSGSAASRRRLPARRPACRRLVPPGAARAEARRSLARSSPRPPSRPGRDPATLGMEGRVSWSSDGVAKARRSRRSLAGRRRDPRLDQHDERRARPGGAAPRCPRRRCRGALTARHPSESLPLTSTTDDPAADVGVAVRLSAPFVGFRGAAGAPSQPSAARLSRPVAGGAGAHQRRHSTPRYRTSPGGRFWTQPAGSGPDGHVAARSAATNDNYAVTPSRGPS